MSLLDALLAYVPAMVVAGVLFLIEWRRARGGDWKINLQSWALQIVVALVLLPLMPAWHGKGLIDAGAMPLWAGFAAFALTRDFLEWGYHRLQHRVPFLWALHSLHHSDPAMGALTTQRHHWMDQLIKQATIWSATLLLVTPTPQILGCYAILALWNFPVHSALPLNLGRWSWVINSSDYHRIHHSKRPEDYDINFAALFPIWDLLFGSYRRPCERPETGLDHEPRGLLDLAVWPLRGAPKPAPQPTTT